MTIEVDHVRDALVYRRRQREAQAVAEPFIRLKVDILAVAVPKYLLREGEAWKVEYSPEVQVQLAEVDRLLDLEMARLAERWRLES